jgi:hypothetical protein
VKKIFTGYFMAGNKKWAEKFRPGIFAYLIIWLDYC